MTNTAKTTVTSFTAHGRTVQVRTTTYPTLPTTREVWVPTFCGTERTWKAVGFLTHDAAGRASGAFARWGFQPYPGAEVPFRRIPGTFTTRNAVMAEFVARFAAVVLPDVDEPIHEP